MRPVLLNVICIVLLTLFFCGEPNAIRAEPAATSPDLAAQLAALTAPQQAALQLRLAELITSPEPSGAAPLISGLVSELRRMTLAEADALGAHMDAEYGGAGSEFALYPVQREEWGIAEAEKVHKRLSQGAIPLNPPCFESDQTFPWLDKRLGRTVKEIRGLGLTLEYDDLGPVPTELCDGDLACVAAFPGLRFVELQKSKITDAGLIHLQGLRNLEHLNLKDTAISDEGLRHLAGLTGLKQLDLERTRIRGPGLAHFAKCPNLTEIRLSLDDRLESDLDSLNQLQSLQELTIYGASKLDLERTRIRGPGLAHCAKCPDLTEIRLGLDDCLESDLDSLNQLRSLEELTVYGASKLDLHDLPQLKKVSAMLSGHQDQDVELRLVNLPQLTDLWLSSDSPLGLRMNAANLPQILRMSIYSNDNIPLPYQEIGRLTNLRELHAGNGSPISEASVRQLAGLHRLTRLAFNGDVDAPAVQHLAHFTALRHLHFGGSTIDDAELRHLSRMQLLQTLHVFRIHGSGQGFEVLDQLPKLRSLALGNVTLSSLRIENHPSLESLHAQSCQMGELQVTGSPQLSHFDIRNMHIKSVTLRDLPKLSYLAASLHRADLLESFTIEKTPGLKLIQLVPMDDRGGIDHVPYASAIGDPVLANIAECPLVERVSLEHSSATDEGLKLLEGLPELVDASVTGPAISEAGRQRLQAVVEARQAKRYSIINGRK